MKPMLVFLIPVFMSCLFQLFAINIAQGQLEHLRLTSVSTDASKRSLLPQIRASTAMTVIAAATCSMLVALVGLTRSPGLLRQRTTSSTKTHQRQRAVVDAAVRQYALSSERARISEEISLLLFPHLLNVIRVSNESRNLELAMEVRQRVDMVATGIGAIMSELHRRLIADVGLARSLQCLVEEFRKASATDTAISIDAASAAVDVPTDTKLAIYRVTQEALNNIERHSNATRARVSVAMRGAFLTIGIEDNGKGFTHSPNGLSRGLKNIRERANSIGARITWEPAESFNNGTLVRISLPLYSCSPEQITEANTSLG